MMNINLQSTDRSAAGLLNLITNIVADFADGKRAIVAQQDPARGRTIYRMTHD